MKVITFLFLFAATATLAPAQSATQPHSGGPEVFYDRATAEIFPESWRTEKVGARAEPLSQAEQGRCRALVSKALAKYPAQVLSTHLQKLYIVGRLEYRGVTTGGTNSRKSVYLASTSRYSTRDIEKNLHAEFSSILLRNKPECIDHTAWEKINPPAFHYRGTGVEAIRGQQASLRLNEALHQEGFLNEYGKASLEEDFNSFAGRLFMGDSALWIAIEKYPKVRAKADLVITFYQKLDPTFTRNFFLSLRQPEGK